ncbi:MAG TPA: lysylphosphatidylglycerol synthase domain-containing protein [Planctomycetaceae bacterium]|nr:lysylphosphatidylglycerol synthase domain-containing protein [Planctomycetaceae bacterium]
MEPVELPSAKRFTAKFWVKTALTILVLGFVGYRAWTLVRGQDFSQFSICPGWLALSGLFYALGWGPSIWFWKNLLGSMGETPGWILCGKAYFAGHLGKYIPGKAGVLLLRAGVLKGRKFGFGAGVLTAAYETLTFMGIGLVVAGSLAPALVPPETLTRWSETIPVVFESRWVPGIVLCAFTLLATPAIAVILSKLGKQFASTAVPDVRISNGQLLKGFAAFILSWGLLGLSLGAAIQSVSDRPFALADWPVWTAAASAATVIGFFAVFTPGGLGVREGIMIEILRIQPEILQSQAVFAAVLLRLVWMATEAVVYVAFSWFEKRGHRLKAQG